MNRMAQVAVLLSLLEKLEEYHSWCGETHIQKATFLLKELFQVNLEYNFILYKHGPYSFDLNDALGRLRAEGLVKVVPQDPYGPRILPSAAWKELKAKFPKTLAKCEEKINFLGRWLGSKKVADLEKLATAFYVTQELRKRASFRQRARRIVELKPHVSLSEAEEALREVDTMVKDAADLSAA